MNILYFAPINIYPHDRGNSATIYEFILRLKENGNHIYYLYLNEENTSPLNIFLAQNYVDALDVVNQNKRLEKTPEGYYKFDTYFQNDLGEKVAELCETYKIDVAICTYVQYSKILEFVPKNILKIIDTHDKMSDRHFLLDSYNIKNEFFSCSVNDEAKYLNRADIIWARRDEERDFFNAITNSNKAITVSHFNKPHYLTRDVCSIEKIGFFASDNNVNVFAVRDLVNELLKNQDFLCSNIEILIAGNLIKMIANDSDFIKKAKKAHIKFIGVVEKTIDFYKSIDLVIIPISFGTGINVKTVEAMSFGMPILSTIVGSKGINTNCRYHKAKNIAEMINNLLLIKNNKSEIKQLINISKEIYQNFYIENCKKFDNCFSNLKI